MSSSPATASSSNNATSSASTFASSSNTPPSQPSNSTSIAIGIVIGILILLVGGVLFYFLYIKKRRRLWREKIPTNGGTPLGSGRSNSNSINNPTLRITPFGGPGSSETPRFVHTPGANMRIATRRFDGAWTFSDPRDPFTPTGVSELEDEIIPSPSPASPYLTNSNSSSNPPSRRGSAAHAFPFPPHSRDMYHGGSGNGSRPGTPLSAMSIPSPTSATGLLAPPGPRSHTHVHSKSKSGSQSIKTSAALAKEREANPNPNAHLHLHLHSYGYTKRNSNISTASASTSISRKGTFDDCDPGDVIPPPAYVHTHDPPHQPHPHPASRPHSPLLNSDQNPFSPNLNPNPSLLPSTHSSNSRPQTLRTPHTPLTPRTPLTPHQNTQPQSQHVPSDVTSDGDWPLSPLSPAEPSPLEPGLGRVLGGVGIGGGWLAGEMGGVGMSPPITVLLGRVGVDGR